MNTYTRVESGATTPAAGSTASSNEVAPPQFAIDLAVEVSCFSPCHSKRGVVIFSDGNVISNGYNFKPRGFDCDGSEACKATCGREAVHAEQMALVAAGHSRAHASEMLHVKTVDGKLVPSGGPSCVECSKLARAVGIVWVWLYHADGWRRYSGQEFHALSLHCGTAQRESIADVVSLMRKQADDVWHISGHEDCARSLVDFANRVESSLVK